MNEQLEQIIKASVSDADLTAAELPRIDLYLDQILSLVAEKNAEGSDRYTGRVLTKTMINNYSKEGAILPLKGKKYNRHQVLQILFIYSLKTTLSIAEIKRIFDGTNALEGFGEAEFEELWNDYLVMKEHSRAETEKICGAILDGLSLDLSKDDDYLRLLLSVVSLSAYLKMVAETMIDARFPIVEEEDEEKSSKEGKTAAKADKKKAKKKEKASRLAKVEEELAEEE
ncbi:MAG: DUF1836 domain-containing protein [Clostridia bacterium]|nr:DUF1836 domain-containing protein [Clostridia bacterium]